MQIHQKQGEPGTEETAPSEVYQPIFASRIRGYMPAINTIAGCGPLYRHEHVWLADSE